ncbi:VWA domain-containing protein [candidate division KSB1 bacterium]|nr:VWA domain-containing protein [candidate division KSB1 bacterium]
MFRKIKSSYWGILFLLAVWSSQALSVGALFSRRLRSNQTYQKMWIKNVDTDVLIEGQIAVTHIDQTFHNDMNDLVEAIFVFPLPDGAVITELVYWFNGQRWVAEIRELQQAIKDYNNKIRQYLDPALLQYLGDNLFRLNIAPINPNSDVRFEITYTELLAYDFHKISYEFYLNTTALSPKPLERVLLNVDISSQSPIKYLSSPSHEQSTATRITQISENAYNILFGDENFIPDKDFILEFETVRENVDVHVLTYTPTVADSFGEDSFYALWITPPDSVDDDEVIPKNIIITADVSSSMEKGTRLQQLKLALNSFIDHLLPIDMFNIVSFGTHVQSFREDLVVASDDNIEDAREYVRQLSASGLTAINDALQTSLNQSFGDTSLNTLLFLTDGYPTWGETNIEKIVINATNANTKNVHIFPFGIGDEISEVLLDNLGRENGGYATYITADDSIALMVSDHFKRITKPILTDLSIDIPGLLSWERFPKSLPDLFWGSQVLEMGLYSNSGDFDITLNGKIRGRPVSYSNFVVFADTIGGCRFVPRLWAKAKIDYLLEQIEIYGEIQELVDAIIELSIRFSILTPYTAFYSDPDPTAVDDQHATEALVKGFELHQNYPNPFNPTTEISYTLPRGTQHHFVVIKVYDMLGRLVKTLVAENKAPGTHKVIWDGTDTLGQRVPSGVYVVTMQVGDFKQSRKMILMK